MFEIGGKTMSEPRKIHVVLEDAGPDRSSWPIASLLLPFIAAIAGTVVVLAMDLFQLRTNQENFAEEQSVLGQQFEVVRGQEDRRLAMADDRLVSELVVSLQASTEYNTRRRAIALIEELFGVERAITVEAFNRSGGTVRALQDLLSKLADENQLEEEVELVALKSALETVPTALFIDSAFNNNPYCEASKDNQRTNIDDIFPIVRHLPFKFSAERIPYSVFGDDSAQELRQKIVSSEPELIVIHNGAFDGSAFGEERDSNVVFTDFLAPIFEAYSPSVIVYSRTPGFSGNAPDWFKEFGSRSPYFEKLDVEVLPTEGDSTNNRDCFAKGMPNGTRILQAIERAFATTESYRLGLP